ncbi:MAG: alpha/beta hydrolase [Candidatus Bathyarchaeota archaeon]|nr:alpha/beta hydrolase [Candidatus Bathyarchaeota archaeon]MDH5787325.1 alpha/beta hydrolase [Candidatus Bathyarchaeota archaeon]
MNKLLTSEKVKVNGQSISCLLQKGAKESIVFIHGFGASKETFLEAFEREEFQNFTMLAADLIGFGDSDKPIDFSYEMTDQARILRKAIDLLDLNRFHLVAHSMGGIIGIKLGKMVPDRLCSFINAEGNITAEDCTISKQVAGMGDEYFALEGLEQLKRSIAEEAERTQDWVLRDYVKSLSKATPESLYKSSVSTVYESNFGDLLTRFSQLPFYKCYIYGEKNTGVFPAEKLLEQKGIPLFYVSNSGHSMMKENPDEFYDLVLNIVRRREHL